MRGKQHDPSVRGAVIAALLAGQGVNSVARDYKLSPATVKTWKRQAKSSGGIREGSTTDELVQPQKDAVGYDELVDRYLRENLTTLANQQVFFRDESWLKRQSAADLAVLHGVSTDKAIKILEAIERAAQEGGTAS